VNTESEESGHATHLISYIILYKIVEIECFLKSFLLISTFMLVEHFLKRQIKTKVLRCKEINLFKIEKKLITKNFKTNRLFN